ncbi:MAG: MBL fold metallo-hydrolase [Thermoplasmata archaeon]|nr:MBL fold metallo-hydrolase [Thermoplasmata archaeon]
MIQLDVLCIGFLEREEDGSIREAHSTSTLIRTGGRNIVVDTSTEYMWPAVKTSFRQIGIFPEDVDTIILTHTHSDHVGNLKRYPKAKVYVHKGGKSEIPNAVIVEEDDFQVCPGVRMVHTPGHCTEECSVFIEADRRYVCAGDTIPLEANLREGKPPALNTDRRLAIESMDRIREYADVVIPGHGAPFMVR